MQGESQQGGQGDGQSSQGQSDGGNQSSGSSNEKNKVFDLETTGILTQSQDVDWDSVKNEVENLYGDLPSITMDLYQIGNINQEDILNFNKEYDNLASLVKNENKEETLAQLTKIYDYLPKFLRSSQQKELYTTLVETKTNIFKGYSKLDSGNWNEISNDIKIATENYSKLLTNTEIEQQKKSNISKGYIMINELQNAINIKETPVFLIKYKNLLEEINNI